MSHRDVVVAEKLEPRLQLAGAVLVKDIAPGLDSSQPRALTEVNGAIFFTASQQLFTSDGTTAGTLPLTVLPKAAFDFDTGAALGSYFIFNNGSDHSRSDLWRSDGTPDGTFLLKSNVVARNAHMYAADGYLLFSGLDVTGLLPRLWRTDGTPEGTVMVKDINLDPHNFVEFNGSIYLTDGLNGSGKLWKTDGSSDGTLLVNPNTFVTPPVIYKNKLYYSGCDAASGCELWSTDGSGPGAMIADINPGTASSSISNLTFSRDQLYFVATDASRGQELRRTDGANVFSFDLVPGTGPGASRRVIDVNGTLFFSNGAQLWNIASAGPRIVSSIPALQLENFTSASALLFFTTTDDGLWMSDGSASGTQRFIGHQQPTTGTPSLYLTEFNAELYFRAIDPSVGAELFKLSPPSARSTGPYTIGVMTPLRLDASQSSDPDPAATLSFAWDLDGDGIFAETGSAAARGDEVGPNPTFQTSASGVFPVSLRVTSSSGLTSQLTTSITVRGLSIPGTSGDDTLRVAFNPTTQLFDIYENTPAGAGPTFSIRSAHGLNFDSAAGNDTLILDTYIRFTYTAGAGNDSLDINAGDQTFSFDSGSRGLENITLSNTASLLFLTSQHLSSLILNESSTSTLSGTNTTLHTSSLSLSQNTSLDLMTNSLVVDSADLIILTNLIKTGLTGTHGLRSSSTLSNRRLGAITNTNTTGGPLYTSFAGESNLTGGEILLLHTLIGDLNLDRQVTIADFINLAAHFNQTPATWADGDINDDSIVSIADFIELASNFGKSTSSLAAPATPQAALSASSESLNVIERNRTARSTPRHHRRLIHHPAQPRESHVWLGK